MPRGFTDRVGRMLAEKLTKTLGQTVLVENRPGASGSIGSEQVARGAPDGYLLLTTSDSTVRLMQDKRVDAATDFVQISLLATQPVYLAVGPTMPARTIAESGYPSYQLMLWYGMVAPKGTPQAIVDRLSRELKAALVEPDMQSRLKEGGTDPIGSSPKELVSFVDAEVAKWRTLIK